MLQRRLFVCCAIAGAAAVLAQATAPAGAVVPCPLAGSRAATCCPPPGTAGQPNRAVPCCYSPTATAQPVCCPPAGSATAQPVCCPPAGSATAQPACCPPAGSATAQPACCPPNALCAPLLTIGSSPDPSKAGRAVTISGRLTRSGSARATITLWQRLPGESRFRRVGQTETDARGGYRFVRVPATNRQWYATGDGQTSSVDSQQVYAWVTLHARAFGTAARGRTVLWGRVRPNHDGERILIQRLSGREWRTVAQAILRPAPEDHASRFRATLALAASSGAQLRAELPGDARNIASVSPTVTV